VKERRRQATHPAAVKPELIAERPNAGCSWDITRLGGAAKWNWFYLDVIIDIFSRYVPGWMLATVENHTNARALLADTMAKQNITPGQLYIHSDRGSPMIAKPVAFMLAELGVTKSHSRPHVSNDNPFSEAQFRTLKYRPGFPDRFGSFTHARQHCEAFFAWYDLEHRHSGIGLHTPFDVHHGQAATIRAQRQVVLDTAYTAHGERATSLRAQRRAQSVTSVIRMLCSPNVSADGRMPTRTLIPARS
jgi:putative transposase